MNCNLKVVERKLSIKYAKKNLGRIYYLNILEVLETYEAVCLITSDV